MIQRLKEIHVHRKYFTDIQITMTRTITATEVTVQELMRPTSLYTTLNTTNIADIISFFTLSHIKKSE